MSGEEIERLLHAAPPGTRFEFLRITLPEAAAETAEATAVAPAEDWSPEAVVEWVQQTYGPDGLKLKEWARLPIGVSMRELERASRDGRLDCREKGQGKDHRALVTGPGAMRSFLCGGVDAQPCEAL